MTIGLTQLNPITLPIKAILLDLDGVLVKHPEPGHNRFDYQWLRYFEDLCIEYHNYLASDREKARQWLIENYNILNERNEASADKSYGLAIMTKSLNPSMIATREQIQSVKEFITMSDAHYSHLVQKNGNKDDRYEHDEELIRVLKDIKEQNPGIGIFANSGNDRFKTLKKAQSIGLDSILTNDLLDPTPPHIWRTHI